jgi:CBS domain-containing membrane protein
MGIKKTGGFKMMMNASCQFPGSLSIDLSDADVLEAMTSIQGYIDITPKDFKEIYQLAFRYAIDRLFRSVTAEQIMTREVITVAPNTDLIQTARIMSDAGISGVPVVSDDRNVIGVISEKDFLRRMGGSDSDSFMSVIAQCLSNRGCLAIPIRGKTAKDIMTTPAITVRSDRSISDLSRLLRDKNINRIPIVDDHDRLIGIVSRGDIVNSYCANVLA